MQSIYDVIRYLIDKAPVHDETTAVAMRDAVTAREKGYNSTDEYLRAKDQPARDGGPQGNLGPGRSDSYTQDSTSRGTSPDSRIPDTVGSRETGTAGVIAPGDRQPGGVPDSFGVAPADSTSDRPGLLGSTAEKLGISQEKPAATFHGEVVTNDTAKTDEKDAEIARLRAELAAKNA